LWNTGVWTEHQTTTEVWDTFDKMNKPTDQKSFQ